VGDPSAWRLRAAAEGSGTGVLGRGVPKKRPVSDLSKALKVKAAESTTACWAALAASAALSLAAVAASAVVLPTCYVV
jgi:hypothetical protein